MKSVELVYPVELVPPKGRFFFSRTDFSGGDENRIRFNHEGDDYFAFNKTVRTNFKAGDPNDPSESAGIFIRLKGKARPVRRCSDFVGVSDIAVKHFDRE